MASRPTENPSLQLLGRSRAERLLDSLYARQREQLRKRRRQEILEARKKILLPEEREARRRLLEKLSRKKEEVCNQRATEASGPPAKLSSSQSSSQAPKSVEAALQDLIQKHFNSKTKFARAVNLLRQLWEAYFKTSPSAAEQRPFVAALLAASSSDLAYSDASGREALRIFFETGVQPLLDACKERQILLATQSKRESEDRRRRNEAEFAQRLTEKLFSETKESNTRASRLAEAAAEALQRAEGGEGPSSRNREEKTFSQQGGLQRNSTQETHGETGEAKEPKGQESPTSAVSVHLSEDFVPLLRALRIRCILHARLETDDAFQFNGAMSELREVLQSLLQETLEAAEAGASEEEDEEDEENEEDEEGEENEENEGEGVDDARRQQSQNAVPSAVEGQSSFSSSMTSPSSNAQKDKHLRVKKEPSEFFPNGQEAASYQKDDESPHPTAVKEEPDLANQIKSEELQTKSEKEEVDVEVEWPLPLSASSLLVLRKCFFIDALATAFKFRSISWARASVEQLFVLAYRHRNIFTPSEEHQIRSWQADLKALTKPSSGVMAEAIAAGEAHVPVRDAREERIVTTHGQSGESVLLQSEIERNLLLPTSSSISKCVA